MPADASSSSTTGHRRHSRRAGALQVADPVGGSGDQQGSRGHATRELAPPETATTWCSSTTTRSRPPAGSTLWSREAQSDDRIAAVGAKLLFPNGQVQHAGVVIGQDRWPHHLYAGFPGAIPRSSGSRRRHRRDRRVHARPPDGLRRWSVVSTRRFTMATRTSTSAYGSASMGRLIRYCHRSVVYHLESVTRWPAGLPPAGQRCSERV